MGVLSDLRIVDFGQYLAGPLTATYFADQGAQVDHIDPPSGPRFKHAANAFLMRGRRRHEVDLKDGEQRDKVRALIDCADVVIENFRPGVMARLGLGANECLRRNRRLIYCSIPGFAALDKRAALAGWEGVVMAAGSAYWRDANRPNQTYPFIAAASGVGARFSQLPLASVFASGLAATAIAAALIARERDGRGQSIEVPLADAMMEAHGVFAMQVERPNPPDPMLAFGIGVYACRDGRALCLLTVQFRHLIALVQAAGKQDWIESGLVDYATLKADPGKADALRRALIDLFRTRDALDWEPLLREAGVPIGAVRSTKEWVREPAAMAGKTFIELDDPEIGAVRMPAAAIRFAVTAPEERAREGLTPLPEPKAAEGAKAGAQEITTPPLAGLKVLDLTRVLAAPTTTRLLADMGADVVKVDLPPAMFQSAAAEPILHLFANRGKRGRALNLKDDAERAEFETMVKGADVLVTNFRTTGLRGVALDEPSLRALNPDLVIDYLNTYGSQGPWAHHRGYAEIANAVTGVSDTTSDWNALPSGSGPGNDPPWPYTDSMAGILGAFATVLAIYDRMKNGRAQRVEVSLAMAATLEQIPAPIDFAGKVWPEPLRGRARGWSNLHRLYDVRDGVIFLSVAHKDVDEVLDRLGVQGIGEIESRLKDMSLADACGRLCFGSTAAHPVYGMGENLKQGGFADRRGLRLEQVSPDNGVVVSQAPVMRLTRTPMKAGPMPGKFGADSREEIARMFEK